MTRRVWPRRLLYVGLFATALTIFLAWRFASGGRAIRSGLLVFDELRGDVSVHFDARGVPHVEAQHDVDLAFAAGFLQANDRLLQLELGRRAASGRLAEVLGSSLVPVDARMRALGLRRVAEESWVVLGVRGREWLDAYAAGVNSRVAAFDGRLPPLVRLLGAEPEPWTPVDSLCFAGLMAYQLEPPRIQERRRARIVARLGRAALNDLVGEDVAFDPGLLEWLSPFIESGRASTPARPAPKGGSNGWAVDGTRSASGAPLLAADPHLDIGLPAQWYAMGLHGPSYRAAGFCLPGLPLIVIGHSEQRAWTFTNTGADTNDIFLEQFDGERDSVLRGGEWLPVVRSPDSIGVRFGDDVAAETAYVDGDPFFDSDGEFPAHTLRWAALEPSNPFPFFFALAQEVEFGTVMQAAEEFRAPVQTLVFAERDATGGPGRVGYQVVGRVPERNGPVGRMAARFDAGSWSELRSVHSNPGVPAASNGFVSSANADVIPPDHERSFVADFAHPSRQERVARALRARVDWDVDAMTHLQLDTLSLYAEEFLAGMVARVNAGAAFQDDAQRAFEALCDWNARFDASGPGLLALRVKYELERAVFTDEVGVAGVWVGNDRTLLDVLRGETAFDWADDRRTEEPESVDAHLERALAEGWRWCEARFGRDPAAFELQATQLLSVEHALGALPLLGSKLGRGPFPIAGHTSTIPAVWGRWSADGERRESRGGASLRLVVDLGDLDAGRWVLPGGQSGHPLDRHYDDQLDAYIAGKTFPLPFSSSARRSAAVSELRLVPVPN